MNVVQVCSMDILVLFIAACAGLGNRDTDRTCTWYATVLPLTQTARAVLRRVVLPLHQNAETVVGVMYTRAGVLVWACIRSLCLLCSPLRLSGFLVGW